jgi:arylsulfatase A-like enzyme
MIRLIPIIALLFAMPAAAEKPPVVSSTLRDEPSGSDSNESQPKPNVILIITDDQGYGDMSCHGNPILKTPNLDMLHAQSVRLTDFHVDPMCAPTRAALMTGRYSARAGVWSTLTGCYIPPRSEITLGHLFSAAGYGTAMSGKWHLGDTYPYGAEHRGFQHVIRHGAGVIGEVPDYWNNDYFEDTYLENGRWLKYTGFCTDIWFNEIIDYIRSHRDEPFFCYLATNAPHGPYNVHGRWVKPYLDAGVPKRRARFYGLIANIDENVGRLMDFLDHEKLADNAILIFMGDNGTAGGVSRGKDGTCKPPSPATPMSAAWSSAPRRRILSSSPATAGAPRARRCPIARCTCARAS